MARQTTFGTCLLCERRFSKAGITRHLTTCAPADDLTLGRPTRLFHVGVEAQDSRLYWINLEIKASATLRALDAFLRDLWLECCGHMSAFMIAGETFTVALDPDPAFLEPDDRDMNIQLGRVLKPSMHFTYEYDFGSTTRLMLRVVGERKGRIGAESLRLLARNEVPVWSCGLCHGEAIFICSQCAWDIDADAFWCEEHAEDHECGEEMLLPVVNSPRMGVCGYSGSG